MAARRAAWKTRQPPSKCTLTGATEQVSLGDPACATAVTG